MREEKMRRSGGRAGRAMSVALISLGCAKNLVDGEEMLGRLGAAGFVVGAAPEAADVLVVNTCAFVGEARAEARRALREAAALRRGGACRLLIVSGCYPQRDGAKLREAFPEIDVLVGTGEFPRIAEIIAGGAGDAVGAPEYLTDRTAPRLRTGAPWTAYLKIAEGCSNMCAYCVIPALRGRRRSRPAADLAAEARSLAASGVKELVLVAQDTTAYGADRPGGETLPLLLRRLDRVAGLRWVRLMYAHPARVTDELLETIAGASRILRYLDIPLQHAHPEILRRMGRAGGAEDYPELLNRIRRAAPGVCLRTTFLTGFPGETERHFEALLRFVRAARFDRAGVFAYSREAGTPAAAMDGQVPDAEKRSRRARLLAMQREISKRINESFIGKELEVLVETRDARGGAAGRTYRDAPEVDGLFRLAAAGGAVPGEFVRAVVEKATAYDLAGRAKA